MVSFFGAILPSVKFIIVFASVALNPNLFVSSDVNHIQTLYQMRHPISINPVWQLKKDSPCHPVNCPLKLLININNLTISPDSLQIIEQTILRREQVDDDILIIHKYPG